MPTPRDRIALDRRFWIPNVVFLLDGAAYFGILNLLTLHLGTTLGLGDIIAGRLVSYMTGALTLFMAIFGGAVDRVGVRRTMTWTIVAAFAGRALLVVAPTGALAIPTVVIALTAIALGAGLLQTAVYAAVKQATDDTTSGVGFSLIYSLMNLGIVLESLASSTLRETYGTTGVFAACTALTGVYLAVHLVGFPADAGAPVRRSATPGEHGPARAHPLTDARFLTFIFSLLGVRTLFAHQWLTMPDYVTRCFPEDVGAKFEWISALNPAIIVVGTPLVAVMTARVPVLTMMIAGTTLSAGSTLLLVGDPNLSLLLTYVVLFSIGEALWSSRFLEYVAQIAPPDQLGTYMGVANVPWFLAKFTTGLYSGWMLQRYVPAADTGAAQDPATMWAIYAAIAMSSPVLLVLASPWLRNVDSVRSATKT
jgi:POT family proton-dependent oligopeptide transporter